MNTLVKSISLIVLSAVLYSCGNDDLQQLNKAVDPAQSKLGNQFELDTKYLSEVDQIKMMFGEAISNYLLKDAKFKDQLFSRLITADNQTKELLYIKEKDRTFMGGSTLEELLKDYYRDDSNKLSLLDKVNTVLPNLVIKIPDWAEAVLGKEDLKLEFAVYPSVTDRSKNGFYYKDGQLVASNPDKKGANIISEYLPIQVKESEQLIPVGSDGHTTFWGNDFYEDNFPFLSDCKDFNLANYTVHSNEVFEFVDKIALNTDLMQGKLCTTSFTTTTETTDCTIVYERDCRTEKNVIEGLKLTNISTFIGLNNQPGGEDVMSLHYQFSVASMCGNLMQNEFCPPDDWKFVFFGRFFDFFELQSIAGYPLQSELTNVYFIGNGYYLKAFPIYYDIPVDLSTEGIYTQARYLPLSPNGTWDGNKYGDAISLAIYEHDDVTVDVTQTNSITVTNTTKVSSKLSLGEVFSAGADFSNTVTRSSSTTITIDASADVELGKTAANYYEENFSSGSFGYGFNVTTGAVNTHFAFYYEQ